MGLVERATTASRWADLLVEELNENLRERWGKRFADVIAYELYDTLDEDFQEDMPPQPARALASELAAELREKLALELQEDLPEDVRRRLHDELERLLFEQMSQGRPADSIRKVASHREHILAERWARWLAGELTRRLLERLADRLSPRGRRVD